MTASEILAKLSEIRHDNADGDVQWMRLELLDKLREIAELRRVMNSHGNYWSEALGGLRCRFCGDIIVEENEQRRTSRHRACCPAHEKYLEQR